MYQGWPDIEIWWIWWLFLSPALLILLPPIVGSVVGWRMAWVTGTFGFLTGVVFGAVALTLYAFWSLRFREHFLRGAPEALEAFGGLACLLAIQLLMVVSILSYINCRRGRRR